MRKNLLKPLFVAAFGMMACLSANAQMVSNATTSMQEGDEIWASYFKLKVAAVDASSNTTYDVNIIGLSGADAGDYEGDTQTEIEIPNALTVTNGGTTFTLNIKSVTKLQGYDALETLTFTDDFAGTIAAGAITNLSALTKVVALGSTPATIERLAFDNSIVFNAAVTFVIPSGAEAAYCKAEGWQRFLNINNGTFTIGDTNGDGVIKSVDTTRLKQYSRGKYTPTVNDSQLDVNGSGGWSSADATVLFQKMRGSYKIK